MSLRGVVVLVHVGRVALGAHEVPVLRGRVQCSGSVVSDVLLRIEVKPALAALRLRARIPGDRERLHAAVGRFDQVLLQRLDAEGVLDLEVGELAVGSVGADEILPVAPEEGRRHPGVGEVRIVEVAQHACGRCVLHRELVLRALPRGVLLVMALGTGLRADVVSLRKGRRRDRLRRALQEPPAERKGCQQHRARE